MLICFGIGFKKFITNIAADLSGHIITSHTQWVLARTICDMLREMAICGIW